MAPAHVYLLVHATEPRLKIGKSINPMSRAIGLGYGQFDFERSQAWALDTVEDAFNLERILHRTFRAYRMKPADVQGGKCRDGRTEWFAAECLDELTQFLSTNASVLRCRMASAEIWNGEQKSNEWNASELQTGVPEIQELSTPRTQVAKNFFAPLQNNKYKLYADEALKRAQDDEELERITTAVWIALADLSRISDRAVLLAEPDSYYAELCVRFSCGNEKALAAVEHLLRVGKIDFHSDFDEMKVPIPQFNLFLGYSGDSQEWPSLTSIVIGVFWNPDIWACNAMFLRAVQRLRQLHLGILGWDVAITEEARQWAEELVHKNERRFREKRERYNKLVPRKP